MKIGDLVAIGPKDVLDLTLGVREYTGVILNEAPEYEGQIEPRLFEVYSYAGIVEYIFEDEISLINDAGRFNESR